MDGSTSPYKLDFPNVLSIYVADNATNPEMLHLN